MIKYTPKAIDGNVNVSSSSPLKDFFELVIKITGLLLVIYIVLGVSVDYMAPRLSVDMEVKIGKLFLKQFDNEKRSGQEEHIQLILNDLIHHADITLPQMGYQVHVVESKEVNALAFPGGHIVILSGLLNEVESKNELAMVLAHELGHFVHRDHLRSLGRGLVFLVLSTLFLGTDSFTSNFLAGFISSADMKFSQAQETAADLFGLDLIQKTYGHVAGTTDFFEKAKAKEKMGKFFHFFSSHPHPQERVQMIKRVIEEKGYQTGDKISLDYLNKEF